MSWLDENFNFKPIFDLNKANSFENDDVVMKEEEPENMLLDLRKTKSEV